MELLEVLCPAHADSGLPAVGVAPCDPISVLYPYAAGVIAVLPGICGGSFRVVVYPFYLFGIDVPVNTVLGKSRVDSHISRLVVNSEHACEFSLKGNHGAVEYGIAGGEQVAGDYRIGGIAPDNVLAALGSVLPWNIGNRLTVKNFYAHFFAFLSKIVISNYVSAPSRQ